MSEQQFEVTVVIPAFNPGSHLIEAVESALAQTLDCEVLVVDDGSDEAAFPALPASPRLRIVRQLNAGVAAARNCGVSESAAPLLAFLDADDRWAPQKLEKQVDLLKRTPAATACYTAFTIIDAEGRFAAPGWAVDGARYQSLLTSNPIAMSSAVVRRDALLEAGGFDPSYSIVADWDLWLRLAMTGSFVYVPESLVEYRMSPHGIGQMSGEPMAALRETMSVYERHALRARRARDRAWLDAISEGRANARRLRARQAGERFVDSIGLECDADWRMLAMALTIAPAGAASAAARRVGRACRRTLVRRGAGMAAGARLTSTASPHQDREGT